MCSYWRSRLLLQARCGMSSPLVTGVVRTQRDNAQNAAQWFAGPSLESPAWMHRQDFSDELEAWLKSDGPKTLGELGETFGEKSFAVTILLLMFVPAAPVADGRHLARVRGHHHRHRAPDGARAAHDLAPEAMAAARARRHDDRKGRPVHHPAGPLVREVLAARGSPRLFSQRWFIRVIGLVIIALDDRRVPRAAVLGRSTRCPRSASWRSAGDHPRRHRGPRHRHGDRHGRDRAHRHGRRRHRALHQRALLIIDVARVTCLASFPRVIAYRTDREEASTNAVP